MNSVRPRLDVVIVKLLPPDPVSSLITVPNPKDQPLSKGIVQRVGPGRRKRVHGSDDKNIFIPTDVKPGERVVFFTAATGDQKRRFTQYLSEDEVFVQETDILFVYDDDVRVDL